jgi:hypothetical protein
LTGTNENPLGSNPKPSQSNKTGQAIKSLSRFLWEASPLKMGANAIGNNIIKQATCRKNSVTLS